MKRFILIGLALALLGVMAVPALTAPQSASAWWWSWWGSQSNNAVIACDTNQLHFSVVQGDIRSQHIKIWNDGDGSMSWRVSDYARWLSASPSRGSSRGEQDDVKVRASTTGLEAGTYHATITVSSSQASNSPLTLPVTLEVVEPNEVGPILLGIERLWRADNYWGTAIMLLTGEELLDIGAITIGDSWKLSLDYGEEAGGVIPVTGGTLDGRGVIPDADVLGGQLQDLSIVMPALAGNYLVVLVLDTDGNGLPDETYMGALLTDLEGLLDLLPMLMGDSSTSVLDQGRVTSGITIPMGPILELLPTLLPIIEDLLPQVLPYIQPLLGLVPPIMVLMPQDVAELLLGLLVGVM